MPILIDIRCIPYIKYIAKGKQAMNSVGTMIETDGVKDVRLPNVSNMKKEMNRKGRGNITNWQATKF